MNRVAKMNILVVDDDPFVRETIQMLLKCDGHRVCEANSGAEALAMFEPEKFDLVFTDYLMPTMKGDELASVIKRRSPRLPIILLTGCLEQLERCAHTLGDIDMVVGKPFAFETVREALV